MSGKLKRIDPAAGIAQTICEVGNNFNGAAWNRNDVIIFGSNGQLMRVPAQGGEPRTLEKPLKGERVRYWPHFLPDDEHFLYNSENERQEETGVYIGSLNGGIRKKLLGPDTKAVHAGLGYMLFSRAANLYAQSFDARRMELTGDAAPLAESLLTFGTAAGANFFASSNGVLAYRTGNSGADSQLIWFDRSGKPAGTVGTPGQFTNPALSPNEKWLAVGKLDMQAKSRDLWLYDLTRGTSTRLTFDPADDLNPAWSPDGSRIAFTSNRRGHRDVYTMDASGTREPEILLESPLQKNVEQWSPDGKYILLNLQAPNKPADLYLVPVMGERTATPLLNSPFAEDMAAVSPDGRWIAYRSNESGTQEIYVQNFAPASASPRRKWRVSPDGGGEPQWRADGKELFYTRGSTLMAVDLKTSGAEFEAGLPKPLFDKMLSTQVRNRYLASRDGQRFLFITPADDLSSGSIHVVVNWHAGLKR